jgi:hypothetical protein
MRGTITGIHRRVRTPAIVAMQNEYYAFGARAEQAMQAVAG